MSSSGLSDLSSPLSSGADTPLDPVPKGKLEHYFKHGFSASHSVSPPKKKRPPSPPHEYVLADNPDIAFICIFRSRFSDAFQKSLPHYGPQDIEFGVTETPASDYVERLLCALLGLVLNRKKDVEKGHYQRALEEAVQTHVSQWPALWQGKNPLHGGGNFNNMTPEQRLTLMKALIMWALESSEAVKTIIRDSYRQSRHEDDLNQPLSVQAWGKDGDKRRYWLIEGQDDTHFRLYRESNPALRTTTWRSIAGTIDEVRRVAEVLAEENTQSSRRLRERITAAIPRFEASEDKRKRRDYRVARKAQFTRPDPGFSLYEGRTRGKRIRYTYSDEEGGSDSMSPKRSTRQSGISTPAESTGPTYTASGRQVRSRHGGTYGETTLTGQHESTEHDRPDKEGLDAIDTDHSRSRSRRSVQENGVRTKTQTQRNVDSYDSEDVKNDESDVTSSGHEWQGGDEDEADDNIDDDEDDEDIDMSDVEGSEEGARSFDTPQGSLMVTLRYAKRNASSKAAIGDEVASKEHQSTVTTSTDMQQDKIWHNDTSQSNLPMHSESTNGIPTQSTTTTAESTRKQMPEYAFHAPVHAPAPSSVPAETTKAVENPGISQYQPPESYNQHPLPIKPLLDSSISPPGPFGDSTQYPSQ